MRGVYKVLVGLVVAFFFAGLLALSVFIVNKSEAEKPVKSNRLMFIDGDSNLGHMKKMYNEGTLSDDMKEFLGDNYKEYKGILKKIKKEHKKIFSEIYDGEVKESLGGIERFSLYREEGLPNFNIKKEDDTDCIIENGLSIISFLDDCVAIMEYDYGSESKQLFVVDYTNSIMPKDRKELFKVGEDMGIYIDADKLKIETYDEWEVLYVRGV